MFSPKSLCLSSFAAAFFLSLAQTPVHAAPGYWRVRGRVENVDSDVFGVRRCEMANLRLRFRSRWANGAGCIVGFSGECPWGPSWGETTTNSQGEFSKRSVWFGNRSTKRDVLIEFKRLGVWRTLQIISDIDGATPHQTQGNTWIFDRGTLTTTAFDCPTEFSSADTPPTPMFADNVPGGGGAGGGGGPGGNGPSGSTPQVAPIPCGLGANGKSTIDLEIVSSDVRHRDNQPNSPPERVTWEVTIRNNGTGTYAGTGSCRVSVRAVFTIPELGTERPYEMQLSGAIAPGQSRTFTSNSGNLGEVSAAESLSYNVLFFVDPQNRIVEVNEQNNQVQGCYTPSTEFYVESPCPAASQNNAAAPKRNAPPRRDLHKHPTPAKKPLPKKQVSKKAVKSQVKSSTRVKQAIRNQVRRSVLKQGF